jgi:hypothetical protein
VSIRIIYVAAAVGKNNGGVAGVTGWDDIGATFRVFDGPEWRIKRTTDHERRADIVVSVVGLQYAEEHAELEIIIDCPDTPVIRPAEARKLGRALIAAAGAAEASGVGLVSGAGRKSASPVSE